MSDYRAFLASKAPRVTPTGVDWRKHEVSCSECAKHIMRRLNRPSDGAAISAFFCSLACKAQSQRRAKPVSREWLVQKYQIEGLGCPEIARLVGRNSKRVFDWLIDFGIPTRPRGSDIRQQFKPGVALFLGKTHSAKSRLKISESNKGKPKKPKGEKHHWAGVVGENHPRWNGGATPERQSFYSSQEWKRACVAVWQASDAKCQRCGADSRTKTGAAFHVHHVVSFRVRELRADPSNLKLLCAPCHRWVHSKSNLNRDFLRVATQ